MKTLIILLLLITSTVHADEWTTADTKREAAYLTLHTVDWLQTRNIARSPDQFYETNAVLGKHPSIGQVNSYFIATAALQFAIARVLPAEYRSAFQYLSIGHDFGYVSHNFKIGISVKY